MNNKTLVSLSISFALLASNANAVTNVADARGNAMANTGVASANYLTAPFYNPALGANFDAKDDFGFFIAADLSVNDEDESLQMIDDVQEVAETAHENLIKHYLDQLNSNAPLSSVANAGFAMAIPSNTVSVNLFGRGYTEIIGTVTTSASDSTPIKTRYDESTVDMLAFSYAEIGLSFAKKFTLVGEQISFGVTPKFQRMTTYSQITSLDTFDIDDLDKNEISKDAFNLDLGVAWYKENFRVAIAATDLFAQEIDVYDIYYANYDSYNLETQVTVAVAYSSDYFTAAIDVDLTEQTRFEQVDDETQFVRLGIEGNVWGWAQLRAGYEIDVQDTLDNTITAGMGISPFDRLSFDIAASYTGDNQFGASASLALTF